MNLQNLTIEKLQDGYKKKDFSVTDVTKAYLDRIKKLDPKLNSFLTVTEDYALQSAKEQDSLVGTNNMQSLFGVPIGLKDIFVTCGIRTTASSKVLDNYIPQYDATVVNRLKKAGAIILGKLNCDAWAHGSSGENSDYGPSKNPWDINYTPGGSSSGSAVATAANLVVAASGSDTGGSIRLPASFTNTVGLKPTYGLVSRYGIISMASSLDSIGHFTKKVSDSALILNITQGLDGYDATLKRPTVSDYIRNIKKGISGLKIGVPKEFVGKGVDWEVKKIFENAVRVFQKLEAEVVEVSLPMTDYGIACYYILQPSEVSSNLARFDGIRYGKGREKFGDEAKRRIMLGTFTLSSGYYDAYYKKAMQVRTLIKQDFDKAFEKVDALISPVSPTLPWKLGEKVSDPLAMYLSDALTVTVNIAGIPSLSVPAGFSEGNPSTSSGSKLPVGIQIMGPHFSEEKLFQIGYAFEQETHYYQKIPQI